VNPEAVHEPVDRELVLTDAVEVGHQSLDSVCGWPDLVMGTSTAWPHYLLTVPTLKSDSSPVVWMDRLRRSRVIPLSATHLDKAAIERLKMCCWLQRPGSAI
jgi:hypothetical protein